MSEHIALPQHTTQRPTPSRPAASEAQAQTQTSGLTGPMISAVNAELARMAAPAPVQPATIVRLPNRAQLIAQDENAFNVPHVDTAKGIAIGLLVAVPFWALVAKLLLG